MTTHIHAATSDGKRTMMFQGLLAMVLGGSAALMFALMANLSPVRSAGLTIVTGVFVGELVYSLVYMRRRGLKDRERELEKRSAELDALEAELRVQRAAMEQMMQEPQRFEPYRHHEEHMESPGCDQGQLTSRLPGATPFFEDLDKEYGPLWVSPQALLEEKRGKRKI